ncbi:hypothetical protein PL8927_220036 [Planktothrix serta PCC 8927]|uniref:Uncharacterized protein n=1 Tax=Planktothrix serta PCC 8927 TaxID=671068 RepID=A0A7Z9BGP7_9CYAN|nr:hypothetical protein PL8927_220036 [Planktothrix serta PCC 8927]
MPIDLGSLDLILNCYNLYQSLNLSRFKGQIEYDLTAITRNRKIGQ